MYVSTRVLDALDAASKLSNVSHAADNAQAVIKTIENLKITDEKIVLLAKRAFDNVIAAFDLCKRITDSGAELNETIRDDARRLATLLGNIEQECKKISKKKLNLLITRKVTKFVNKMHKELDSMAMFQENTVSVIGMSRQTSGTSTSTTSTKTSASDTSEESVASASNSFDSGSTPDAATPTPSRYSSTSESSHGTSPSSNTTGTPRINAQGRLNASVFRSGCDTTTRTIYSDSGEATETSKARNTSDSTRILATGDNVIIADSGNDSEHTSYYQQGESPGQRTNTDQMSGADIDAQIQSFVTRQLEAMSMSMGLPQGPGQPSQASQPYRIAFQSSYPQQGMPQHIQKLLAKA